MTDKPYSPIAMSGDTTWAELTAHSANARARKAERDEVSPYVRAGIERAAAVKPKPGPQTREAMRLCELIKARQANHRDGYLGVYTPGQHEGDFF